ncbi:MULTISPECIES: AAA family ATPase [unclassified Microbacterium]|uniref:ATP-binding protein n=1 Tax=unclassified Microbacterium TaxID=2609290 RepID=UPI0024694B50|nr:MULTISPECIES: AAA family ATPase [unclassified Microbacterium]MDH5134300.1 AAA family ATPase [Microbacterium sp. RD10]MDH5137693.1 AAA family ATPase [Microbacterium sp. RD11]MDH5145489.1 AAA family ATPase [Microbacterium sp. RD12]MDH5155753.1 AAA family ATPase [Microbacterium sp. RD06]MDH5166420.1 AAA family ATPase [Microbacterium sp. RD02]
MIQVQKLRIEEFRGVRDLDLDMGSSSFVVVGPNGSGKSGVVDAIDFALTGNVARLSGAGTGGISVAKHAPHVHQRDNPAAASVTLTFTHPASRQTGTLTRSVKTAGQFTLEPKTPELVAAVEWAARHPELILSRREVIKYVNTEPGKRAQEVQALLKLDRIDETRRLLNTARNKTSTAARSADDAVKSAEDAVKRGLDITDLLPSEVTVAVNKKREVLGLEPLSATTLETDLSAGTKTDDSQSTFNRASAIRDIEAVTSYLAEHKDLDTAVSDLDTGLTELEADPAVLDALKHRQLVEAGLPLVINTACPLCDLEWPDVASLRQHLNDKLVRSETAAKLQQRIQTAAGKVTGQLRGVRSLIQAAQPHAVTLGQSALQTSLLDWSNDLAAFEAKLATIESIRDESERITTDPLAAPSPIADGLKTLRATIEAQPDQTATEAARTFLTVAQDRWTQLRQARAKATKATAAHKVANEVYEKYNSVADAALTTLYKTVETDFSNFYRQINSDDESSFKAGLSPTAGKLDLEVDFYGLGMFPPMAYHSEGHQDGMGVCLYLALIRQLLKSDFRLAVLDDVVTSVDANHRRQFCKLLKDVFPDVQFIMTTHDEVWARQMQSSGLIARRSLARFHGWTVDGGPFYGQGVDFWTQIETDLASDDVPGAAHKLRRNLESSLADVAASIQGQVVFRADNNYDLSSFFSAVKGRHGDLLKKATASANSWNNDAAKQKVEDLKSERATAILAQDGENWAINALVHNNDWATMTKADFAPVVEACKQFLELFTCSNDACDGWIYVLGIPGKEEELRCSCGDFNLNLRKK